MILSKEVVASMINDQIRNLDESEALYKPDPHAGYILVDPVTIAALEHWWGEYQKLELPEQSGTKEMR